MRKLFVITALFALCLAQAAAARAEEPVRGVLKNGMPVLARQCDGELSAACVFVKAGTAYEAPEKRGITELLARMLLSCDPLRTVTPPVMKIEQQGGQVTVETGPDFVCFKLLAPAKNFGPALKVLADVFRKQDCSAGALSVEKESMAAARRKVDDRIEERAYGIYTEKAFDGLVLGRHGLGGDATVKGLRPDDLRAWQSAYFRPDNMVLSICSRLQPGYAVKLAEESFSGVSSPSPGAAAGWRPLGVKAPAAFDYKEKAEGSRAAAVIGYPFPAPGSPDLPACLVAEAMLSGGMGSSLYERLRGKDEAAYQFGSYIAESRWAPHLVFYLVTDGGRIGRAVNSVKEAVDELKKGEFGNEELARAKAVAAGTIRLRQESALGEAWFEGVAEVFGLGPDEDSRLIKEFEKVTGTDIVRVSGKYLGTPGIVILDAGVQSASGGRDDH